MFDARWSQFATPGSLATVLTTPTPSHPWTIAELAEEVGLSRSALADRFTRYLSEPPMAYLTGWRLRLAAEALTSTPKGVADIGADVGYDSEAAFNRAFKRVFACRRRATGAIAGIRWLRQHNARSQPSPT